MGIFSFLQNLFGGSQSSEVDADVERIFMKIDRLLNDEATQNNMYINMPDDVRNNFFSLLHKGETPDEIAGASGPFGRAYTNPIPVNGVLGEFNYLNLLRIAGTNEKVYFHRICSLQDRIDVFELVSQSGTFYDALYFDMYYMGKSSKVPDGYVFAETVATVRGITQTVANFPADLYQEINKETKIRFGLPIADKDAMKIDVGRAQALIPEERQQFFTRLTDHWDPTVKLNINMSRNLFQK